jgi:hypothetical protein
MGFNLSNGYAPGTLGFSNIQAVIGSTAPNNTLVGANTTNTWSLTGTNAGNINGSVTFSNFQYLTGGSANDTFRFNPGTGVSGIINGGGGTNSLNYANYGKSVGVNLTTSTAPGLLSFTNIQGLVGNTGTNNTLVGANTTNTWNITGTNAGNVNGTFAFSAMSYLTGGSGNDTFKFRSGGYVTGIIDGGGGFNSLDYSSLSIGVTVNLATTAASDVVGGVIRINGVLGGAGNNTLTGGSQSAFLVGGPGSDTLTAGNGRAILIGGTGADTLTGGSNDDILISGTTNYDANLAVLDLVLAEWARTDISYSQRVADLSGPNGGLNGSNFLNSSTVFNDASVNTLNHGSAGTDWLFSSSSDIIH